MMTKSHAWRMAGRKHVAAAFASFWLSLAALPALAQFSDMGALTQRAPGGSTLTVLFLDV
jgi:hypothetical protein